MSDETSGDDQNPETTEPDSGSSTESGSDSSTDSDSDSDGGSNEDFPGSDDPSQISDDQLRGLAVPVLAFIAGRSVMLDARRAAANARKLLPLGQIELWPQASHAVNGEYPDEIAARAALFWNEADARR